MDFLDPKKKRAHTIRLYIGYGLMAIAILSAAYLLLEVARGNWIDKQGNVYQNGLVFVASRPDAAEVTLTNIQTGKSQKAVTAQRLALPAAQYNFEFLKQDYRPWQHQVDLRGGGIERLVYPVLFPQELKTRDVTRYSESPVMSTTSPDRRTLLVQQPGKLRVLDVFDTATGEKAAEPVTIPNNLITSRGSDGKLQVVEWASNNRQLLLKHKVNDHYEYIIVDIENPARSVNINKQFNINPKNVALFDERTARIYLHRSDNTLVRASTASGSTESVAVANNVLAFKAHGDDTVLYATTNNRSASNKVSVLLQRDNQAYKLRELPAGSRYLLDMARFNDRWNVAIGASKDEHAYIYRDPIETLTSSDPGRSMAIRTMRIHHPQQISFSENAQFIAAQNGGNFVVYDSLDNEQVSYTIETPFDDGKPTLWMDGHRLINSSGGKVVVFDFDGTNYQTLSPVLPTASALFDADYKFMYTLAPSQDGKQTALSSTNLTVE